MEGNNFEECIPTNLENNNKELLILYRVEQFIISWSRTVLFFLTNNEKIIKILKLNRDKLSNLIWIIMYDLTFFLQFNILVELTYKLMTHKGLVLYDRTCHLI